MHLHNKHTHSIHRTMFRFPPFCRAHNIEWLSVFRFYYHWRGASLLEKGTDSVCEGNYTHKSEKAHKSTLVFSRARLTTHTRRRHLSHLFGLGSHLQPCRAAQKYGALSLAPFLITSHTTKPMTSWACDL